MSAAGDRYRDVLMLALAFATGALDAWSYLGFGRVFTANMTGNIILLAVESGMRDVAHVERSALALAAYAIGVALGARLAGARREEIVWPARLTRTLAVESAILVALALTWTLADARTQAVRSTCVALGAIAMGMQGSAVLALGVDGIPTTYETGVATMWLRQLVRPEVDVDDWVRPATIGAVVVGAAASVGAWYLVPAIVAWLPVAAVAAVVLSARRRFGARAAA